MASASSSSHSSRRRRRPSIPLIRCPSCGVKQILELTATTEANRGRIFFTCPDHVKDGSGCNFWYWEEAYIKFLKRSGFIDEATCAELLKEAKMKDRDEMKKRSAQEFKKEPDVGHFKQLENMIFILTKMMVLLKLIQAGATAGTEIQHETEFAPEIDIAPTEKTW
uniref:GRF-type domain-containing protein n=1 Tax=Oryza barthii TaxID=65489 RepID=A0A0D3GRC4_9ORYZ